MTRRVFPSRASGCGAVWLARIVRDDEAPGSNPGTPTNITGEGQAPSCRPSPFLFIRAPRGEVPPMATVHSEGTVPEQSLPPGRISGICQRETGEPLAGLRVNVYGPDDILVDTQKTDGRGRYATRLLFSGKYRVELRRFPDGV